MQVSDKTKEQADLVLGNKEVTPEVITPCYLYNPSLECYAAYNEDNQTYYWTGCPMDWVEFSTISEAKEVLTKKWRDGPGKGIKIVDGTAMGAKVLALTE